MYVYLKRARKHIIRCEACVCIYILMRFEFKLSPRDQLASYFYISEENAAKQRLVGAGLTGRVSTHDSQNKVIGCFSNYELECGVENTFANADVINLLFKSI